LLFQSYFSPVVTTDKVVPPDTADSLEKEALTPVLVSPMNQLPVV